MRRKRSGPPAAVIACCLSAGARFGRQNCTAGARLKIRLTSRASEKLKIKIRRSGCEENGRSPAVRLQIMLMSHAEMRGAIAIPSTPPARPSSRPSTSNCCTTRVRFAPNA